VGVRIRRLLTAIEKEDCFNFLLNHEISQRNMPDAVVNTILSHKLEIMGEFRYGIAKVKTTLEVLCNQAMDLYQKAQVIAQTPPPTNSGG